MRGEVYIKDDLEYIGEGGFAEVYKIKSQNKVLKKLKEPFLDNKDITHRFKREFELTRALSSIEGIIKVFDYNQTGHWYTMELAEYSLYEYMNKNTFTGDERKDFIKTIVSIMKLVHDKNIIHRDISPQNILIIDGKLNMSDFGLGKDLEIFHSHRTVYTNAYGQYSYCAPEQFMKLKDGDKKSDIFSLGRLINFIMTDDPLNKQHYLRNVCEKACSENPNMRYESAEQLLKSLHRAIEYEDNATYKDVILKKINSKIFNEDVENFILRLPQKELCHLFIKYPNLKSAFLEFISLSDERAEEYMTIIYSNYTDVINRYEDNDVFSDLAEMILDGSYTFVAKEQAALILSHNAWSVGRFSSQRIIESLIEQGVEPMLEEIIKQS